MIIPDGPPFTSYLIRSKTPACPLTSTTKPMLTPENIISSVFGAIMTEENLRIGSSECYRPHMVQPSRSVCLTPTMESRAVVRLEPKSQSSGPGIGDWWALAEYSTLIPTRVRVAEIMFPEPMI